MGREGYVMDNCLRNPFYHYFKVYKGKCGCNHALFQCSCYNNFWNLKGLIGRVLIPYFDYFIYYAHPSCDVKETDFN